MTLPRISCLTITRERPGLLRRAIELFRRQTWPEKEMVVVVDRRGSIDWVDGLLEEVGGSDLKLLVPPEVGHLGALRNASVAEASGEIVATWDDDDLYHPTRLEVQARAMKDEGADASFLLDTVEYFEDAGDLFVVRWEPIGLPPSMLCRRDVLPKYRETVGDAAIGQKGSDTPVQMALHRERKVSMVREAPHLYTRVYHGRNVWSRIHHAQMVFKTCPDDATVETLMKGLAPKLREYVSFALPDGVVCRDGGRILFED